MRLLISLLVVMLALVTGGCASPPPSCDGSERRPVNEPSQVGALYVSCAAHA